MLSFINAKYLPLIKKNIGHEKASYGIFNLSRIL